MFLHVVIPPCPCGCVVYMCQTIFRGGCKSSPPRETGAQPTAFFNEPLNLFINADIVTGDWSSMYCLLQSSTQEAQTIHNE